jgi:hypothetical protein
VNLEKLKLYKYIFHFLTRYTNDLLISCFVKCVDLTSNLFQRRQDDQVNHIDNRNQKTLCAKFQPEAHFQCKALKHSRQRSWLTSRRSLNSSRQETTYFQSRGLNLINPINTIDANVTIQGQTPGLFYDL